MLKHITANERQTVQIPGDASERRTQHHDSKPTRHIPTGGVRGPPLIEGKLETTLMEMANANRIAIEKINTERGNPPRNVNSIRVTGDNLRPGKTRGSRSGMNTRDNVAPANTTPNAPRCSWDYATELGVRIGKIADLTKMADCSDGQRDRWTGV